jgi:hypothetical protein
VTKLDDGDKQTYIGLTATDFKARYTNHKFSLTHSDKRNATELSKHVWKLRDNNTPYELSWAVVKKSYAYSNTAKMCNLCLNEKFYIICRPEMATLNKRSEIASKCRHAWSYLLGNQATTRGGAKRTKRRAG